MRFHLGLGSKAKKLFVSSPTKKKPLNGEIQVGNLEPGLGGFRSPDYGIILFLMEKFFVSFPSF